MILGIKFAARPTMSQAQTLSSWMGSAKFIWNAKCQEDHYLRTFARKYLPLHTYPLLDQQYSQYKNDDLSPFLKECPSQILRNAAANWFQSYQQFFKIGDRGRPKVKGRGKGLSIHLTRELFQFQSTAAGLKLMIGTKKFNLGELRVCWHDLQWMKHGFPKSLRIKKLPSGKFTVSFCYEDESDQAGMNSSTAPSVQMDQSYWKEHILATKNRETLDKEVMGIDRGIIVPVATDEK